jgi:putative ABC transport system permease protein
LALGIGANTAVFGIVDAVLLRPLPYADAEKLVVVSSDLADPTGGLTLEAYDAIRAQRGSFDGVAVFYRNTGWSRVTLAGNGEPEFVQGAFVSANLSAVLGVAPLLGRWITTDDEQRAEHVVVISDALWRKRFAASLDVLGKTVRVDDVSARIIGVMPAPFAFPARETQFWAPITTNRFWAERPPEFTGRSRGFYERWGVVARLARDATPRGAQTELTTIAQRLGEMGSGSGPSPGINANLYALPLREGPAGSMRLALLVLFGATGLVLLIACSNIANLLLARGKMREREMALRTALGATRGRLVRQLVIENLALAVGGGGVGLLFGSLGIRALVTVGPPDLPRLEQARLDGRVFAFTCAVSLLAVALFALGPAWRLTQRDAGEILKAGGKGSAGATAATRVRNVLVIVELALAVLLVAGAGLLTRSLLAVQAVHPGFRIDGAITLQVALPSTAAASRRAVLVEQLAERLRALPRVQWVGAINGLFEPEGASRLGLRTVEGHAPEARVRWTALTWKSVSDDYFQAMGIRLLRGRYFSRLDDSTTQPVAILDVAAARRYWPGEDAIGKRFKGQDPRGRNDDWVTVIGLVNDTHRQGLERDAAPTIYVTGRQSGDLTPDVVVRTAGDPNALAASIRGTVRGVDPSTVVSRLALLERSVAEQVAPRRFQTLLLAVFAVLAMTLAGIGVYGVIYSSVAQRTREFGIRMALGARPRDVATQVLIEAGKLAVVGLGIGLFAGWWVTKLLAHLLFAIQPADPVTFAGAAAILGGVALVASYIPARRAMRGDPVIALRNE